MSLSVCLVTDVPAAQVAAVLAPLRQLADEVVLAVDAGRVPADQAGAYEAVADIVVRAPIRAPMERSLQWLHGRCSKDWILRLDGDEVAGAALVEQLRAVMAEPDCTHAWVARRWLFGDADHALDERPWWPDLQLRLVRNDPALLRFPGEVHTSVEPLGPGRVLTGPLYHTDLLVSDRPSREAKVRRYEALDFGTRVAGQPMNRAYYLPEDAPAPRTCEVPAEDREAVGRLVAAARAPRPRGAGARVEEETEDAIAAAVQQEAADVAAADGRVVPDFRDRRLVVDEGVNLLVEVVNDGPGPWRAADAPEREFRVAAQWRDEHGQPGPDGPRTRLTRDVGPGESLALLAHVVAPSRPGTWTLRLGMLLERVRWFAVTEPFTFTVVAQRRVGIVAGYNAFRHVGDDAIVAAHLHELARHAPDVVPVLFGDPPEALAERFSSAAVASVHVALDPTGRGGDGPGARLRMLWHGVSVVRAAHDPSRRADATAPARAFLDELERCDAVIAASAGGLASRCWRHVLWPHAVTLLAARAMDIPTAVSGVTVGPFETRLDALVATAGLRAAERIVVRDRDASPRLLRRMGMRRRVRWAPDPAVLLPAAAPDDVRDVLRHAGVDPEQPYVVVALGGFGAAAAVDAVAAVLRSPPLASMQQVLFVPMVEGSGPEDDIGLLPRLRALVPEVDIREPAALPSDVVLAGVVGGARLAIGSRYHLSVFAAAAGVPSVGLVGDAYGARRFAGLVSIWGDLVQVRHLPVDIDEVVELCAAALQSPRAAPERPATLPGVVELLARLAPRVP